MPRAFSTTRVLLATFSICDTVLATVLPRHAAADSNARTIIDYWTPDLIESALPRYLPVDPTASNRSRHSPPPHSAPRHRKSTTDVANSEWDHKWRGTVQNAVGRIYFTISVQRYVCSGTVLADEQADRSIILTAAHCVYDDAHKVFANNVLFIPNQAGTTGIGTDSNCDNDPLGCWAAAFGVVDFDWANRTFPANIPWDYGMYVVPASGAHAGPNHKLDGTPISDNLEEAAGSLTVTFDSPPMAFTYALGYSFAHDPNFMHCAARLANQTAEWRAVHYNALWLAGCGLTPGSSGGPWIQGNADSHNVMSVNSWGSKSGMGAPRFDGVNGGHAESVFALAKCATFEGASSDECVLWSAAMGPDPCNASSGDCATTAPTPAVEDLTDRRASGLLVIIILHCVFLFVCIIFYLFDTTQSPSDRRRLQ